MTFENAFLNMKKYGGRIRRAKYPNFELLIHNDILLTVIYDDESFSPQVATEISVSTKDLMADDWEVNLLGPFVNVTM